MDDLDRDAPDDELSAAAPTLHREWESPGLWPAIAARIAAEEARPGPARPSAWRGGAPWLAAAAAVLVAAGVSLVWLAPGPEVAPAQPAPDAAAGRALLSDPALADIERAEADYTRAIDTLASQAADRAARAGESALLATLRERLVVIDAAIAECRSEIDLNRFNAHLRRQLLAMYQEKRRTLEQILEIEPDAS